MVGLPSGWLNPWKHTKVMAIPENSYSQHMLLDQEIKTHERNETLSYSRKN
jgi:hypothetical protein